jgi:hypothetical protein
MANDLAVALENGQALRPMAAPFRTERDEYCYFAAPATFQMFISGGDGSYVHKTRIGLSPLGLVVGAATMAGNQARKQRARMDAMEAWRPVGQGNVFFTDRRLCIQTGQQWANVWYQDVMTAGNDGVAIQLQRNGEPGLRIILPDIDFFFTIFYWLAFNEIVRPPLA